jgi:hypothetical protein
LLERRSIIVLRRTERGHPDLAKNKLARALTQGR